MRADPRRVVGVALVLGLAVLAAAGPASTASQNALASMSGEDLGWAAFQIQAPSEEITITQEVEDADIPMTFGHLVYDHDKRLVDGAVRTVNVNEIEVHATVNATGAEPTSVHQAPMSETLGRLTWDSVASVDGTAYVVVFFLTDEASHYGYEITGPDTASVEATDGGPDTFHYTAEDLRGPASANLDADSSAWADVLAERSVSVEHTLLGVYSIHQSHAAIATMTTPDGTRECPCLFLNATGPSQVGPGETTFSLTGAGAGNHGAEVIVAGADVRLPT